jgi:uncharacterized protein (TIGR00251 family)
MDVVAAHREGAVLEIRVMARSQPSGIDEVRDGRLVVRVGAAPVDGQANKAVLKLLAAQLRLPASKLRVLRGEQHRNKSILISGRTPAEVRASLDRG